MSAQRPSKTRITLWLALWLATGVALAKDRPRPSPRPTPTPCVRTCRANLDQCKRGCDSAGSPAEIHRCKEQSCTLLLKACLKECAKEKDPGE